MEKIDWQEITEELGEDRWRDDLVVMPRQSRLLLAKLVQENRFLSRDSQQIYYGPDSQVELYDAAKTAYNSLINPIQTEFIDMFINGDLVVNNDDLVVDESTGRVGIGTAVTDARLHLYDGKVRVEHSSDSPAIYLTDQTDNDTYGLVFIRSTDSLHIVGDAANRSPSSGKTIVSIKYGNGVQVGVPIGGFKGAGTLNIPVAYYVNGLSVIGDRKTGWTTPTGAASRTGFDTATVTLESLAERFKGLIDDLIAHGIIGA